jgi:hypothetical protein
MDTEFVRELIILAVTCGIFVIGGALLVRSHRARSLEEAAAAVQAASGQSAGAGSVRLSKRQKARLRDREKAGKPAAEETAAPGSELDEE